MSFSFGSARITAVALAAALILGSAPAPAAPPEVPDTAALEARIAAVQALPLPTPTALDEEAVRVGLASEERRLKRSFLELQQAQPEWRDVGIVIAAGVHRLEAVAAQLDRPDLLACEDRLCRLRAPLAVEDDATLVIDSLTVELEQATGTVIVAFGDLFLNTATIQGRDGARLAVTNGDAFRPFVVAYDASRTVIRDSHFTALGFDTFGTTGLSVITASREEPAAHPELTLVGTLIEDLWDGVFVRDAARVETLRNIVTGSARHGIVVRDDSRDVLIALNVVTDSGAVADNGNGIVVSRGVSGAAVVGNRVERAAAAGIQVERDATDLAISGNQLVGSGRDALVVYESGNVEVVSNGILGSGRSGIRVRASDGVRIAQNAFQANGRTGIDVHDWSGASREPNEEERPLIRPTEVTVTGNRFIDNAQGDCLFEGVVTILPADANDC